MKFVVKISTLVLFLASQSVFAAPAVDTDPSPIDCPVEILPKVLEKGYMSLNEEFGEGTQERTRCLSRVSDIKLVFQINQRDKVAGNTSKGAYAAGNIINALNDLRITHGIDDSQIKFVAVIHSGAWQLVLDNTVDESIKHASDNPYQAQIEGLLAEGVELYFCQNTMRGKNIKTNQVIPGIKFVTAGVTALGDFQSLGYKMVQP